LGRRLLEKRLQQEGHLTEGERLAGEIASLFEQVRVELPAALGD
jgi:hypothetical protein